MELVGRVKGSGRPAGLAAYGGYRAERDGFHVSFDPATELVVYVVVVSIAAIRNNAVEELEPWFDTVDPEPLDELLTSARGEQSGVDEVRFAHEGREATIGGDDGL